MSLLFRFHEDAVEGLVDQRVIHGAQALRLWERQLEDELALPVTGDGQTVFPAIWQGTDETGERSLGGNDLRLTRLSGNSTTRCCGGRGFVDHWVLFGAVAFATPNALPTAVDALDSR